MNRRIPALGILILSTFLTAGFMPAGAVRAVEHPTDRGRVLLTMPAPVSRRPAGPASNSRTASPVPAVVPSSQASGAIPRDVEPDPRIQAMMDQVDAATITSYVGALSGAWPIEIDGAPYTITTRRTAGNTSLDEGIEFVGGHLAAAGLQVEYQDWSSGGYTSRNVIGEIKGEAHPEKIVILSAHLDDLPAGSIAPGADDNASGCAAVLLAADIFSHYRWGCTLRFAFWTGEEQGLLGSQVYAHRAYNEGENIVGVLNLDMIGWNSDGSPDLDLHASSSLSQTLDLAYLFVDVVQEYSLELIPEVVPKSYRYSDHASFWDHGYNAILAIEDMDDFNEYYHTINDRVVSINQAFFTDFVKAAIGTFSNSQYGKCGTIHGDEGRKRE